MKIQKKKNWGGGERSGGGRGEGSGWGCQGGCERRIEVFVKIKKKKKKLGGGVRVDVNEELKFFGKIQKKIIWGGGGGVGLGGQDGCERRIEVFVKIQQKKNYFFFGGGGGVGVGWGGGGSGWM